jgi:hypothetical protein
MIKGWGESTASKNTGDSEPDNFLRRVENILPAVVSQTLGARKIANGRYLFHGCEAIDKKDHFPYDFTSHSVIIANPSGLTMMGYGN